jgi:hypothetical protein
MLVDPAAPGTAPALSLLGVTSIVTRSTTYDWNDRVRIRDRKSYGQGYELVRAFPGDLRVWRVVAPAAPAVAAYRLTYAGGPARAKPDGFVAYPLLGRVAHIDLYAKREGQSTLRFDVRSSVVGALRVTGASGSRTFRLGPHTSVSIPLSIPRGKSTLKLELLRVPASELRTTRGVLLSSTWFARATGRGKPVLRATRLSRNPGF